MRAQCRWTRENPRDGNPEADLVDTGASRRRGPARRRSGSGAATGTAVASSTTRPAVSPGMVVLDAIHQIQAEQANDLAVRWNCKAGKCGSCSAEVNGKPRLMCMTRLNELPLDEPVTVEPMRAFPPIKDLVTDVSWNFRVKTADQAVQAARARRAGRHLADGAGRRRSRAGVPEVHRVLPVPGRLPRAARPSACTTSSSARASWSTPRRSRCIRSTPRTASRTAAGARHRLLQHHQVLHQGLPGAHHHHRQRDHPAQGAVVDEFYDPLGRAAEAVQQEGGA